jgi:hypothetical protein
MSDERRHFSHSQLSSALGDAGCLRAWGYRYVEKIKTPVSGRLHIGTAWDAMSRRVLESKIDAIESTNEHFEADASEAEESVIRRFDNPPEESKDGVPLEYDFSDIDLDATRDRLAYAARHYVTDVLPTIIPVSVQREIRIELLPNVDLLGYVDLVERNIDGTLVVTDNKSSSAGRLSYNTDKALVDQQLTFYQAALSKLDNDDTYLTRGWRIVDIGYKRTQAKFLNVFVREHTTDTLNKMADSALANARDQASVLLAVEKAGVFPPTGRGSWKCSERWCGFYDICEYGRRSRTAIPIITGDSEED